MAPSGFSKLRILSESLLQNINIQDEIILLAIILFYYNDTAVPNIQCPGS